MMSLWKKSAALPPLQLLLLLPLLLPLLSQLLLPPLPLLLLLPQLLLPAPWKALK